MLENTKGKGKNVLNVLKNLKLVFKDNYFHYKNEPLESEKADEKFTLKNEETD